MKPVLCSFCKTRFEIPDGCTVGYQRTMNAGIPARSEGYVIQADGAASPEPIHYCEFGEVKEWKK